LRPLLRRELEIEVLGWHLTVKRIMLGAVLIILLVLVALMVADLVGEGSDGPYSNLTEPNNTTGRYEEGDTNAALCVVFIFLVLVLMYFIVVEIRS
jgi:ABC-type spermidine/putrescine transport system permease subunit I